MAGSTYNDSPHLHPLIQPVRDRFFHYQWSMFPHEFRGYYHDLPVGLPGNRSTTVSVYKYQAGWASEPAGQQYLLTKRIRKHHGAGISPILESWLSTSRPTAVFAGHGLPEEISLVCTLAVNCGFKTEDELRAWVLKYIGIDCNGFVNAYYMAIGTFSRVLHSHPSYLSHAKPARSVSEITYDSCMLWASRKDRGNKPDEFKVVQNPSDSAHIAVVDGWYEYGKSLLVTERGGTKRFKDPPGIHYSIYDILSAPPAGCTDLQAGWKVKSRDRKTSDTVVITREMGSR